jgi:hypothetical protein
VTYEYDPSDVPVVAGLLNRPLGSTDDLMTAWHQLQPDGEYKLLKEDLKSEIDFLFTYELREDFNSPGEVKLAESALSITATRPMTDTPSSAWTLWTEVGEAVTPSYIAAHIADVLLTARVKPTPSHASSTVTLYVKAAEHGALSALSAALSLARANSIARSRRMAEEQSVRAAMHRKVVHLGNNPETNGAALTLLSALSVPPRGGEFEQGERDLLRDRLQNIGTSSLTLVDEVGSTLARLAATLQEIDLAKRWHVNQYLLFADADNNGMRRMNYAQTAADLASSYGLSDLKDAAIVVMQSVDPDSMGWKTTGFNLPMSKNDLRAYLRKYRNARSWQYALVVFLATSSPSGSYAANAESAKRSAAGSIRALISRTTYGAHGLPERSNTEFIDDEIVRTEIIALNISGILLGLELEHILNRFAPPSAPDISDWVTGTFATEPRLAKHFAESLALHWDGRFSDSARLSIPLIESAARALLLKLDEPLYRTQRGDSPALPGHGLLRCSARCT